MKIFNLFFFRNFNQLFSTLYVVKDDSEKEGIVDSLIEKKGIVTVCFLNYHAINLSLSDGGMSKSLSNSSFLFRDGVGVKKVLSLRGFLPGINMNGTDLIPLILEKNKIYLNRPLVLIGSSDENVEKASRKLKLDGIRTIASFNGYESFDFYLSELLLLSAKNPIVVLGMGMPKQEKFANFLKDALPESDFLIISGGAIIDRFSGSVERAPSFFVNNNLEWLYRLYKEPRRLSKRVLIGGSFFIICSLIYVFYNKIIDNFNLRDEVNK